MHRHHRLGPMRAMLVALAGTLVLPGLAAAAVGDGASTNVSCPAATQCTVAVVADAGQLQEVTFNPAAPVASVPVTLSSTPASTISYVDCPSSRECVDLGSGSINSPSVAFDPTKPTAPPRRSVALR
jgi:hypothetical protein